ncbi:MAG: tetratricopeptide repeat protein, partial [Bacteroidota bacterium]
IEKYDLSLEDINEVLKEDIGKKMRYDCYLHRSSIYGKLEKADSAYQEVMKATLIYPDSAASYQAKGNFLLMIRKDSFDLAVQHYTDAIMRVNVEEYKSTETTAILYNNRGYSKYKLNNYDEALKDVNQSLKVWGENSYAYRNKALILLAMNREEEACESFQKALQLNYIEQYGIDQEFEQLQNACK